MDPAPACESCGTPLKPGAAFCARCGHHAGDPPTDRVAVVKARIERVQRQQSGLGGIHSVILLYLALLGGQGATFLIAKTTDGFTTELAGTAILSVIILVAAALHRAELTDLLRRPGFGAAAFGAIALASIPIVGIVSSYVHGVDHLFRLHLKSELKVFEGRPLAWTYLLFAAWPAIFEELGFRGIIFSFLRRSLDPRESIFLSAVAFGLLHLSVPMLLTHVPLGLYLGWLRHRSGSLFPSMAAHFLHNALVVTLEACAVLPGWFSPS